MLTGLQCAWCRHFDADYMHGYRCRAFPDGIPVSITDRAILHNHAVAGDGGIQFEPIDEAPDSLVRAMRRQPGQPAS